MWNYLQIKAEKKLLKILQVEVKKIITFDKVTLNLLF